MTDEQTIGRRATRQVSTRTVDFQYFIVVMSQGETGLPVPTVLVDVHGLQTKFHTAVQHRTYVGNQRTTTGLQRQLLRIKQILRGLVVEIERTGDAVTQETEIQTCVPFFRSLPLKVTVDNLIRIEARIVNQTKRIVNRTGYGLLSVVTTDTRVVTRHTVAQTPFQVSQPFGLLQPFFLRHTPCDGSRREETPLVTRGKLARTITTDGSGNHVSAVVAVVGTQGSRHHRALAV